MGIYSLSLEGLKQIRDNIYMVVLKGAVPKGTVGRVVCRLVTRVSSLKGLLQSVAKKQLTSLKGAVPKGTGRRLICSWVTNVSSLKGLLQSAAKKLLTSIEGAVRYHTLVSSDIRTLQKRAVRYAT